MFEKEKLKIRFKEIKLTTFIGKEFLAQMSGNLTEKYVSDFKETDEPFDKDNKLMRQEKAWVWEASDGITFVTSYEAFSFEHMDYVRDALKEEYYKAIRANNAKANKKRFLEDKEWIEI